MCVVPILYCLPGVARPGWDLAGGGARGQQAGRQRQLLGSLNEGRQFIAKKKTKTTSSYNYDAQILLLLPAMTFVFVYKKCGEGG